MFPPTHLINTPITNAPIHPLSAAIIASIGLFSLHPDFGGYTPVAGQSVLSGFGVARVPGSQPKVPITFNMYPTESDPGPYPFPPNAPLRTRHLAATSTRARVIAT